MSKARELAELGAVYDSGALSNRNLIINGAMEVAQRGTSTTTSGAFICDRFSSDSSGGTVTHEQVSVSSSDTPYSSGFRKALKLTNTSAGSTATTDYRRILTKIEAQNIASSGWEYTSSSSNITLSFWVKSSLAGTYSISMYTADGTTQNYSFDYTLVADTWKKVSHTIPGNSNITINSDNGEGYRISIWPHLGTNYTTSGHTDETWAAYSSSSQTGDYAQNWSSTASATFFVTGVQLEVGTEATPFEHRSFGDELQKCERYFQVYADTDYAPVAVGISVSATEARVFLNYRTLMRASASIDGFSNLIHTDRTSYNLAVSGLSRTYGSSGGMVIDVTSSSGATTNRVGILTADVSNSPNYFHVDAEL